MLSKIDPAANSTAESPVAKSAIKPVDGAPYGASELQKMEWANGRSIRYEPVTIVFLTGDYADQVLDLGFNVSELSESQTANWVGGEEKAGKNNDDSRGIRGALQFKNISTRTFSMTFEFWSETSDVRQLVENVAHLQEITGKEKTPPLLTIKIGKAKISPVVCESFSPKYDHPFANQGGFRHGTVTLGLKLQGGANTPHATGKPLSATPLADYGRSKSEAEKETIAKQAKITQVLVDCLGDEDPSQLSNLIADRKINDPAAIAALPPRSLVNLAVSGLNPHVLADPAVQTALGNALAFTMARSEPGGNPTQFDAVTQALMGGDGAGVSGDILTPREDGTSQLSRMQADYQTILQAIQTQSLGADSPVFDRTANPTGFDRLARSASCGMNLRSAGGLNETPPNADSPTAKPDPMQEKLKLETINKFFVGKPSKDEVGLRLGIPKDKADQEFRDCMINALPYGDRSEFDTEVGRCSDQKVTGASVWSNFH